MPTTTHYGFVTPDVGGSAGAWGGLLNAAIVDLDADLHALNLRVIAAEAELAGPLSIAGNGTFTGQVLANTFKQESPASVNNVAAVTQSWEAGADGVLGPMYFSLSLTPSAASQFRIAVFAAADTTGYRKIGMRTTQMYVGASAPSFVGSEMLRVDGTVRATRYLGAGATASNYDATSHSFNNDAGLVGAFLEFPTANRVQLTLNRGPGNAGAGRLYVDEAGFGLLHASGAWAVRAVLATGGVQVLDDAGTLAATFSSAGVTAPGFTGDGATITNLQQSNVTGLAGALGTLTTNIATANTNATTANTNASAAVATANAARPFASAINDNVPVARVSFGGSLGYTGAASGVRALNNILNLGAPGATAAIDEQRLMFNTINQLLADLTARGVI